jgi:hypothetical protein
MSTSRHTDYAGLLGLTGVVSHACSFSCEVFCLFCKSSKVSLLAGKVNFELKMSGEVISEQQSFAAFLCPDSYVFFVREQDILARATALVQ